MNADRITLGENTIEVLEGDDIDARRAECQGGLMQMIDAARDFAEVPLRAVFYVVVPEEGRAKGGMAGLTEPLVEALLVSIQALVDAGGQI